MIDLTPPFRSTPLQFPCPNCKTPATVETISKIESDQDIIAFSAFHLNRASCSFCGCQIEAPIRVMVKVPEAPFMDQECIPSELLESPEVVSEVAQKLDEQTVIVFSHDELERSIEARMRIIMHRQGFAGLTSGEVVPLEALNTSR